MIDTALLMQSPPEASFTAFQLILAIITSGGLTSLITYILQRGKVRAEIRRINAETDSNLINQYKSLLDEHKRQSEARVDELSEEVKKMKERETELIKQNTLILEHKKKLSDRVQKMEKDNKRLNSILLNTNRKLKRYERALDEHEIPKPKPEDEDE